MNLIKTVATIILTMFAANVFASELNTGRMAKTSLGVSTGVQISSEARRYPDAVRKAYFAPGTPILVVQGVTSYQKPDFWHIIQTTERSTSVVYSVKERLIKTIPSGRVWRHRGNDLFIIFSLMSAAAMYISLSFWTTKAFGAIFALLAALNTHSISVFIAMVATFLAVILAEQVEPRTYVVYYLLIFMSLGLYLLHFG